MLGFTICEWLFRNHTEYLEDKFTQIKSAVVSRRVCARISHGLQLEECLILGKGMQQGSGVPRSLLSDVFESVIAAIFLDGGFLPASEFILRTMHSELHKRSRITRLATINLPYSSSPNANTERLPSIGSTA